MTVSLGSVQARSFLGPLSGKTCTFLVDGRVANLLFARALMTLLARVDSPCAILDLDALYSSNSDQILGQLPSSFIKSIAIEVPVPGLDLETVLSKTISSDSRTLIVDSLNTFNHLLSPQDPASRSRKLSFAIAALTYLARTEGKAIILTMYKRGDFGRAGPGRAISTLSDLTASVHVTSSVVSFKCERGIAWPGSRYSIRIP